MGQKVGVLKATFSPENEMFYGRDNAPGNLAVEDIESVSAQDLTASFVIHKKGGGTYVAPNSEENVEILSDFLTLKV